MPLGFEPLGQAGRLGNQLWQIASTIGIAIEVNQSPAFPSDWKYRPYFSLPDDFFFARTTCLDFPQAHYTQQVEHIDPRARAYLQDYHLWQHAENEVLSYFRPSAKAEATLRDYCQYLDVPRPLVSIHVRRGDNVTEGPWKAQYHPVPTLDYYREAAGMMGVDRFSEHECSFLVFSDDLPWCRSVFSGVSYFEGGEAMPKEHEPEYAAAEPTDWIDFFTMASCDRHVISNSTFGWWAAYLSGDESPVYPDPWYGPALDYIDTSLMFPDSWRKLSYVA